MVELKNSSQQGSLSYYFEVYGGWEELIKSRYSHVALLITILCFPYWLYKDWWEDVLSIIPNLLGFTLGGYAMLMAFGDSEFHKELATKGDSRYSPLMRVNSTFVHFILLQVLSLVFAIIVKSYYFSPTGILARFIDDFSTLFTLLMGATYFLGFFVFSYALISTIAATFAILRLMKIYDVILRARPLTKVSSDEHPDKDKGTG